MPLELVLLAQIFAPNRLSAGALPQTQWGSLHRSPRPPSWFMGGAHGEREGGRGGEKEGRDGNGGMASRNAQIQSWQAYPRLLRGSDIEGRGYNSPVSVIDLHLNGTGYAS